jgi:hypothetical protein
MPFTLDLENNVRVDDKAPEYRWNCGVFDTEK